MVGDLENNSFVKSLHFGYVTSYLLCSFSFVRKKTILMLLQILLINSWTVLTEHMDIYGFLFSDCTEGLT